MSSFGKRLRECREAKNAFTAGLGKDVGDSLTRSLVSTERDEMKPSIDVANKLAKLVGTTVGLSLRREQTHQRSQRPRHA